MDVTFKDLKKRVTLETAIQQQSKLSAISKDKQFWIWDIQAHKQQVCVLHFELLPSVED